MMAKTLEILLFNYSFRVTGICCPDFLKQMTNFHLKKKSMLHKTKIRIILEVGKFKWILFVDITAGNLFAFSDEGEKNTETHT